MGQKDAELSAILEAFSQRTRKLIEGSVRPVISNLDKKVDEIGARIVGFTDTVQALQEQLNGMEKQADALNVKLMQNSRRVASIAKRQSIQQEKIDEITRRLDELAAEGSPAVIRRNGREAAILREAAYKAIDSVAKGHRREAMRELNRRGTVCRDTEGKFTVPVWMPGYGVIRAVVVVTEGKDDA